MSPIVLVSAIAFKLTLWRPSICREMSIADSRSAAYTQCVSAARALNSLLRSASVRVLLSAYDLATQIHHHHHHHQKQQQCVSRMHVCREKDSPDIAAVALLWLSQS
jgi:hypothetical protein